MRGKDGHQSESQPTHRITPAYAGKSSTSYRWKSGKRDHPRVCGEKRSWLIVVDSTRGSPPRMRGKVLTEYCGTTSSRITPAYAGKRSWNVRDQTEKEDHPRVCGEKLYTPCMIAPRVGSPPRMRGKVNLSEKPMRGGRITPAYAGKSKSTFIGQSPTEDHPRVCGEKPRCFFYFTHEVGSPPHVRGKVVSILDILRNQGITPACAGKRLKKKYEEIENKDHPRMCGEKRGIRLSGGMGRGSPPHVRGKVSISP